MLTVSIQQKLLSKTFCTMQIQKSNHEEQKDSKISHSIILIMTLMATYKGECE